MTSAYHIVFDGPPAPERPRFIELENDAGLSIATGEWRSRPDGLAELVLPAPELAHPIDTAPPGAQIIAHEPMYGWLIVSKQHDGGFLQKSSGNFWMEVPHEVQFTYWLPYPGSLKRFPEASSPDSASDDSQPRYTTKRLHDEIEKAKEYARREAMEEAAAIAEECADRATRFKDEKLNGHSIDFQRFSEGAANAARFIREAAASRQRPPNDDKTHPRFVAGYLAGLNDARLEAGDTASPQQPVGYRWRGIGEWFYAPHAPEGLIAQALYLAAPMPSPQASEPIGWWYQDSTGCIHMSLDMDLGHRHERETGHALNLMFGEPLPSQPFSTAPPPQTQVVTYPALRYAHTQGKTIDEMRQHFRDTELYKLGDAKLVWVNEGDLAIHSVRPAVFDWPDAGPQKDQPAPAPEPNVRTVAELPMTAFADAPPQRDEFNGEQTILTYNSNVGIWDLAFFESGEEFPETWFGDTHWIDITGMWPGVIAQVASFAAAAEGDQPSPQTNVDWQAVAEHYRLAMLEVERRISSQPVREILPGQSVNETAKFISNLSQVLWEARQKVIFKEPLAEPSAQPKMTGALVAIAAERARQIAKGYDAAHDDAHISGEIIKAGWGALARIQDAIHAGRCGSIEGYQKSLIQAAAQIAAEYERVARAALAATATEDDL